MKGPAFGLWCIWKALQQRCGTNTNTGGPPAMPTKLFDVVTLFDSGTTYSPAAAEYVMVDLAACGAEVTLTFPATATEGQCVGVCVLNGIVGEPYGVTLDGPVLNVGSFPTLTKSGATAVFTWDPVAFGGAWVQVAQHAPYTAPATTTQMFDGVTLVNTPGDNVCSEQQLILVDMDAAAADVNVILPDGATTGESALIVRTTVGAGWNCNIGVMVPGEPDPVFSQLFELNRYGDTRLLTWDGATWVEGLAKVSDCEGTRENITGDGVQTAWSFSHGMETNASPLVEVWEYNSPPDFYPRTRVDPSDYTVTLESANDCTVTFGVAPLENSEYQICLVFPTLDQRAPAPVVP